MGSLKEVRLRIASVSSTRKITSAMKMVSSAKLKKAQNAIQNFLPYQEALAMMLKRFLAAESSFATPLSQVREIKRVAIVAISSNSSLCGAFNSNIIKELQQVVSSYPELSKSDFTVYPIGKKVAEGALKSGLHIAEADLSGLTEAPLYVEVCKLSDRLVDGFQQREYDEVVLIFNHFKSAGVQQLTRKSYLPLLLDTAVDTSLVSDRAEVDYLVEPGRVELLSALVPKVVRLELYSTLLDSIAAEHAARTTSMQIATENADDLVRELTLQYNKARQSAITNEIIEVTSGANAQS